MRTIKFRGKRVDNCGEWVYGYVYKIENKDLWFIDNGKKVSHQVIQETVGQFTGLFDKSGKEIYEGDIVEWCDYKMLIEFGEIICEGIGFKWLPINHDRVESITGFIDEYEIIGNIHDNKELLND